VVVRRIADALGVLLSTLIEEAERLGDQRQTCRVSVRRTIAGGE